MGIIGWIVLGLLAGLIARLLLPGEQPGGILATTLVGIVGAVVAGAIAGAAGLGEPLEEFWDLSTWLAAIIGAMVLLLIWNAVVSPRRR